MSGRGVTAIDCWKNYFNIRDLSYLIVFQVGDIVMRQIGRVVTNNIVIIPLLPSVEAELLAHLPPTGQSHGVETDQAQHSQHHSQVLSHIVLLNINPSHNSAGTQQSVWVLHCTEPDWHWRCSFLSLAKPSHSSAFVLLSAFRCCITRKNIFNIFRRSD